MVKSLITDDMLEEYDRYTSSLLLMQVQNDFELGGLRCSYDAVANHIVALSADASFDCYVGISEYGRTFVVHPFICGISSREVAGDNDCKDILSALKDSNVECLYLPSVRNLPYTDTIRERCAVELESLRVLVADQLLDLRCASYLKNLEILIINSTVLGIHRDTAFNKLKVLTCKNITYLSILPSNFQNLERLEVPKVNSFGYKDMNFKNLVYADLRGLKVFDYASFGQCWALRELLLGEDTRVIVRPQYLRLSFVVNQKRVSQEETENGSYE